MNKNKIIAIAIGCVLINQVGITNLKAVPIEVQEENLRSVESEITNLETKIQELDNNITIIGEEILKNQTSIDDLNIDIDKTQVKLENANEKLKTSKKTLNSRIREMYKNNEESVLSIVFSSNTLGQAVNKLDAYSNLNGMDKKLVDEYNGLVKTIETTKKTLSDKKIEVEDLKTQNENKKVELENTKNETNALVEARRVELESINASIEQARRDSEGNTSSQGTNQSTTSALPRVTTSNSGNPAPSTNGNAILDTASKYLGTPYLWGGTSPSGFDCSGFVQYVFKQNGISLSRTTYSQVTEGSAVSLSNLQPGDVVFFGDVSSPYHVGIYYGNGKYIHSPQTGDVVKISDLGSNCSTARRMN